LLILFVCVVLGGCNRPKLGGVPVTGTVSFGGQSLKGGTVSFQPVNAAESRPGTAKILPDGTYSAAMLQNEPGLIPGEYRVSVFALDRPLYEAPPKEQRSVASKVPAKYASPETSGLALTVPGDSSGVTFDIELTD
jgi:hypothetical protein